MDMNIYVIGAVVGAVVVIGFLFAVAFRTVVSTNYVHIVQSSRQTISYGRGQQKGNTYYSWPSWVPVFGVRVTVLPVSVFQQMLMDYAAYDVDRVPFVIDVVAFFRIKDSNMAAERVHDIQDLMEQLKAVLQGAARTILASETIDHILGDRAVFGEKFTTEVTHQLEQWGVEPVKSIELMDIRDSPESHVIANIMAKKQSFIAMESRKAVAENNRAAETAEIEAKQAVDIRQQEAAQIVGQRTAERTQAIGVAEQQAQQEVGLASQRSQQAVNEQAAITASRQMDIERVKQVRAAEITKESQLVAADQARQTQIVRAEGDRDASIRKAEGEKQRVTLEAEGHLSQAQLGAQGIKAEGEAKATAEQLMLTAPVNAQITLAKEIGGNKPYQEYLISIRQIEANQSVGQAQAKALESANVRIVATASDPAQGLTLAKLGAIAGSAVEAFRNTQGTDTPDAPSAPSSAPPRA
jgi:flotillin